MCRALGGANAVTLTVVTAAGLAMSPDAEADGGPPRVDMALARGEQKCCPSVQIHHALSELKGEVRQSSPHATPLRSPAAGIDSPRPTGGAT